MNTSTDTDAAAETPEGGRSQRTIILTRYPSETSSRPSAKARGTFPDVVEMLSTHQLTICTAANCAGKDCPHKRGRAFSFAELHRGTTRASVNVLRVWVAVFDLDDLTVEEARALVRRLKASGYAGVLSSTHSHRPGAPKLRLGLELSRPATAAEWPVLWAALNMALELKADPQARDASRLYFEPTCPSDVKPFAWSQAGAPVDVDAVIAAAPPLPSTSSRPRLTGAEWIALLDQLGEGNRDSGLTRLAGVLFRELAEPRLAELLLHAANARFCKPPLADDQVAKIASSIARREARSFSVAGGQP